VTQPDPINSVQLTRTIDAPPDEVYRAFLEPAQLRKWFGPAGFEVANVDVEARVGGRHHTVIAAPDGTRRASVCEIRELVPGERIVMTRAVASGSGAARAARDHAKTNGGRTNGHRQRKAATAIKAATTQRCL
jgi:uncharacterized protein YndB with AHSA1/START domain